MIDIPVRRLVRTLGFDVERKRPVLVDFLHEHGVGTVLDVGANVGQYARRLRQWGYRRRIISFEPLAAACETLRNNAARDPMWDVCEFGLGAEDRAGTIHVSEASVFSSIFAARAELHAAYPSARAVSTQEIALRRLDSLFEELPREGGAVFLKIDAQGYEREVLRGAKRTLPSVVGVQLELSLTPLYEGETTLADMVRMMEDHGFRMVLIEPVAYDPHSHSLLQVDCIFFRPGAAPS